MRTLVNGALKASLLGAVCCMFSAAAVAQTTRSTPKPFATPPVLSGAEIISQASDYEFPTVTKASVIQGSADKSADKSASANSAARVKELTERINKLESAPKNDYDEKQKRMLLSLDILTRAEQRSESLRKQLFEMVEKESTLRTRLDQIEFDSRPEMIERTLQMQGSMKPEEIREFKRKSLLAEKSNLQALLVEIQSTRANLSSSLNKSEEMVEKVRAKFEKDIDESFLKDDKPED